MKLIIEPSYQCVPSCEVEIPIESFDDIKKWYIKWHTFHYTLDGDTWREIELDDFTFEAMDTKRPISTTIYSDDYSKEYSED